MAAYPFGWYATLIVLSATLLAIGCAPTRDRWDGEIGVVPDTEQSGPEIRWDDDNRRWRVTPRLFGLGESSLLTHTTTGRTERDSILIQAQASPELNFYRERPHVVVVQVLQLGHTRGVAQLQQSAAGMDMLLNDGGRVDGVLRTDESYIEPGASTTIRLDRDEDARYVMIVSGHFAGEPAEIARVIPIPTLPNRIDGWHPATPGNLMAAMPFVPVPSESYPARLQIWLQLGADRITHMAVQPR